MRVLFLSLLHYKCTAIKTGANNGELEVTRHPEEVEVVLPEGDCPLLLSYIVCGSRDRLTQYRLQLTVSHKETGVGGNIKFAFGDKDDAPLVKSSDTYKAHGIAVSKWDATFPGCGYELCYEIPVRVWPDNPNLLDLSIELKLGIRIGRIPKTYSAGKFTFRRPVQDPPTTTVARTEESSAATTSVPDESNSSTVQGEGTVRTFRLISDETESSASVNCRCYCDDLTPP